MKPRFFIDMDGTLAEWRDIKSNSELYQKGYYESLKPNNYLLEEVKNLIKEGKDIYILSSFLSDSDYALKEKNIWLNKYLPELPVDSHLQCATEYHHAPAGARHGPSHSGEGM